MSCPKKNQNAENCICDYDPCPRKGFCCECVAYHRDNQQVPACLRESVEGGFKAEKY